MRKGRVNTMTNLLRITLKNRLPLVHGVLGVTVLVWAGMLGMVLFNHEAVVGIEAAGLLLSLMLLGDIVLFVLLARQQERVWVSDFYRLMPQSAGRLVAANWLSTLLTLLYYWVLALVVCSVVGGLTHAGRFFTGQVSLSAIALIGATYLVVHVFLWSIISLTHLLLRLVTSFLPDIRQKLVRNAIALAMGALILFALDFVLRPVQWLLRPFFDAVAKGPTMVGLSVSLGQGLLNLGVFVVVIGGFGVICRYLIHHWLDTTQRPIG